MSAGQTRGVAWPPPGQVLIHGIGTVSHVINKEDLQPGDVLLNTAPGGLWSRHSLCGVRGHEKVPTGGQVEVPIGGQVEVPTLRVVS